MNDHTTAAEDAAKTPTFDFAKWEAEPIHRIVDPFAAGSDKGNTPVARRQADGGARSIADPHRSGDDAPVADAAFAHSP